MRSPSVPPLSRRAFLGTVAGTLLATAAARAQPAGKVYRLGWLTTGRHPFIANFREGMTGLGYVEGQSYLLIERYTGGRSDRLSDLLAELLRQHLDLLVVSGSAASIAARAASVPVVFVTGDPLGDGLVASLNKPGGGMTGLALLNTEFGAKWVELLKELLPRLSRVAVLRDPAASAKQVESAATAAHTLRVDLQVVEAPDPDSIERGFQRIAAERAGAVVQLSSAMFAASKLTIVRLAAKHRLPTIYEHRDFVEAGGLISYGPDLREVFRRAAGIVDKVLRGIRPADLPVEQPTKIELVINLKTARALGLTIPQSLLLRADQVIE